MKVLVTGVCGQLGHDVIDELALRDYEGIGSGIKSVYSGVQDDVCVKHYIQLDISDSYAVWETLLRVRPDVVVHCASWTAVDDAEDPANRYKVWAVNAEGTRFIAEACRELDCKMMYISTDYVFNGKGSLPWLPDNTDYQPLNVYGLSKLGGELAVSQTLEKYFIVRISWAFGLNGNNFVKTMLRLGRTHETIRVVNDQIGLPTYTVDLACLLVDMIGTDKYGYYHATNEGEYVSWYDFACEIFRQAGMNVNVIPVDTVTYGVSKAARPHNSRLDRNKLVQKGFTLLPDWRDALSRYLAIINSLET